MREYRRLRVPLLNPKTGDCPALECYDAHAGTWTRDAMSDAVCAAFTDLCSESNLSLRH